MLKPRSPLSMPWNRASPRSTPSEPPMSPGPGRHAFQLDRLNFMDMDDDEETHIPVKTRRKLVKRRTEFIVMRASRGTSRPNSSGKGGSGHRRAGSGVGHARRPSGQAGHIRTRSKSSNLQIIPGSSSSTSSTLIESALPGGTSAKSSNETVPRHLVSQFNHHEIPGTFPGPHGRKVLSDKPNLFTRHHPGALDLTSLFLMDPPPGPTTRIGPADKTDGGTGAHEMVPTGTLDLTPARTSMTSDRRSYQPPIAPRVVLTRSRTAGGLARVNRTASRKGRGLPASPRDRSQQPGELDAVSERPTSQEPAGPERVEGVCRTLEPSESGSRVTATGRAKDTRMLSRSSSALRGPPRPPPAHPVPATPDEEVGTATTVDDARVASHKPHPSLSSRAPVQESNTRWSRSRSGSTASANWRGSNMYDDDQDDYGLPSPSPPDPDGMMSHGEYGGIVGPRRDLYSDEELDSVTEENESSVSDGDHEDRTAAMIVADEGRGLIVDAEGRAVSDLDVHPGTTHLLLANNSAPALVPAFLAQTLPQISSTLLCLDISQNNLAALPPALSACTALEELNVSHNPLRSLPSSIGALVSLRVLIADGCDLTALPPLLVNLGALHSLSVRSNRLVMLPVWMCAMPSLEVLKIEGNAFAGPWRGVVEPLLPRDYSPLPSPLPNGTLASPIVLTGSPLPTASPLPSAGPPARPQRSWSAQPQPGTGWGGRPNTTHSLGSSSPNLGVYPTSASAPHSPPSRAGMLSPPPVPVMSPPSSAGASSLNHMHSSPAASSLGHIHSSPGSSFNHLHSSPGSSLNHLHPAPPTPSTAAALNMHLGALAPRGKKAKKRGGGSISGSEIATDIESEVETSRTTVSMTSPRRIKSSDELKRFNESSGPPSAPILSHAPSLPEPQSQIKRYMSLGVRGSGNRTDARHAWSRYSGLAPTGEDEFGYAGSDDGRARSAEDGSNRLSGSGSGFSSDPRFSGTDPRLSGTDPRFSGMEDRTRYSAGPDDDYVHSKQLVDAYAHKHLEDAYSHSKSAASSPEEQRRKGRWGFLKKVSMGRLRSHSNAERLGRIPRAEVGSMPGVPTGQLGLVTGAMGLGSLPRNAPSAPMPLPSAPPPRVDVTTAGSPASSVLTARMLQTKASREALNGAPSPSLLPPTAPRSKRRSFLPFDTPPTLNIPIPSAEPFMPSVVALGTDDDEEATRRAEEEAARVQIALRGVMSYLRDMADLGGAGEGLVPNRRPPLPQYGDGRTKSDGSYASSTSTPPMLRSAPSMASLRGGQDSVNTTDSSGSYGQGFSEDRKYKDDKGRRVAIVREIIETEKSYVKGLQELLDIYVKPSSEPAPGLNVSKETTIPTQERKIVFTGVDSLLQFHKISFLPSLIAAAEILSTGGEDANGQISTRAAHAVANVFVSHAAFMKMYFTYINNFDNAIQRLQFWSAPPSAPNTPGTSTPGTPASGTVGVGLSIAMGVAGVAPDQPNHAALNAGQRKRIKAFLKRARVHPRHSQLNLEGYLLLPIQRIPRYKMLLENLVTCTPPHPEARDDPLERALEEIAVLASSMNEGKRESESRTKLVQWQARIRGKFISPLVQPHRRLIMDGRMQLVRLVKKVNSRADVANPDGTYAQVEVPCLSSDSNPKQLVAILCNDLLVLCKEPPVSEANGHVELWAVLRMQTMAQPASIVSGNGLRLVDNKAILYFNTQSTSEALTWQRAINLHIPHSQ